MRVMWDGSATELCGSSNPSSLSRGVRPMLVTRSAHQAFMRSESVSVNEEVSGSSNAKC
ncbi:hypothetical protein QJS10_CPB21g01374 [Acorus calamus]|uniref:Uncharacterized protein n=1 Tax=Acorus calamus TaxID=4465 RepID=A0AAV9C7E0_ACOCL|nr:hypothetical protein QJS10_CPB21g01374 [Acorus calamus]